MEPTVRALSIYPHLRMILTVISKKDLFSLIAPNGTGRAIGIPWIVSRSGSRTLVSVKSSLEADRFVGVMRKIDPSVTVSRDITSDSDVVYSTHEETRKFLLEKISIDDFGVLMIEDVSNASIENLILVSIWRHYVNTEMRVPRLVLAGSSPANGVYRVAADGSSESTLVDVSSYYINTKNYPYNILYHSSSFDTDSRTFLKEVVKVIAKFDSTMGGGNMMVYLPSEVDVETIRMLLSRVSRAPIITPSTVHTSPTYNKSIILTTDECSSLFTVDVNVIVDSMMANVISTTGTGCHLKEVKYISQKMANRRSSRLGSKQTGVCYRMVTKSHYMSLPRSFPNRPSTLIGSHVLALASHKIPLPKILPGVSKERIAAELRFLLSVKGIDRQMKSTAKGRFIAKSPLSPRNSSVLWDWVMDGLNSTPCAQILSLIDCYTQSFFWTPLKDPVDTTGAYQVKHSEHVSRYFSRFRGRSDVHTLANVWVYFLEETDGLKAKDQEVAVWCSTNSIDYPSMIRAMSKMRQCSEYLAEFDMIDPDVTFLVEDLVDNMREIMLKSYSDRLLTLITDRYKPIYHGKKLSNVYTLAKNSVSGLSSDPPLSLIGLSVTKTGKSNEPVVITLALDVKNDPTGVQGPDYEEAEELTDFIDDVRALEEVPL